MGLTVSNAEIELATEFQRFVRITYCFRAAVDCWLPAVVCAQLISVSHSLVYNRRHDRWTQHENKQTKQSVLHPRNTNATSILSPIFVNFSSGDGEFVSLSLEGFRWRRRRIQMNEFVLKFGTILFVPNRMLPTKSQHQHSSSCEWNGHSGNSSYKVNNKALLVSTEAIFARPTVQCSHSFAKWIVSRGNCAAWTSFLIYIATTRRRIPVFPFVLNFDNTDFVLYYAEGRLHLLLCLPLATEKNPFFLVSEKLYGLFMFMLSFMVLGVDGMAQNP